MKELDALLVRYLDQHYAEADDAERAAFEQFLTLSDPELIGYLLRGEIPDAEITRNVVRRILGGT